MHPDFKEEKGLYKKYGLVVGIDEAGRGPLAGPVVACALCFKKPVRSGVLLGLIKDSKQLSSAQREEAYKLLRQDSNVEWGIGRVYQKTIDKINILEASKLAMKRAVYNLKQDAGYLLIDGNFPLDIDIPQKSIIKGEEKVFSVAAASIVAKIVRDRIMVNYCSKYPQYCFDKHKGYPTKLHKELLKKHGSCSFHRQSFRLG